MSSSDHKETSRTRAIQDLDETPQIHLEPGVRLFDNEFVSQLAALLRDFLPTRRWYRAKTRSIERVEIVDTVSVPEADSHICVIRIQFEEQDEDTYVLPLTAATGPNAAEIASAAGDVLARFQLADGARGIVYGALWKQEFAHALLSAVACDSRFAGAHGEFVARRTRAFDRPCDRSEPALPSVVSKAEQSNSSIVYADRYILKLFRKVETGLNPDMEIGQFLTERGFKNTPAVLGTLEYRGIAAEPMQAGILQAFVRNQGDAWKYTLESLATFFPRVLGAGKNQHAPALSTYHPLALNRTELSGGGLVEIGPYLESARLLGVRTGEMHAALSEAHGDPEFSPEPFTSDDGQKLYDEMRSQAETTFQVLRKSAAITSGSAVEAARQLLASESMIDDRFATLRQYPVSAVRIRHHGDFHLGQVLFTGNDFMIIDFEGEPARPLAERRMKTLAMRDVAGMIRSFQYAAYAALFGQVPGLGIDSNSTEAVESWADYWTAVVSAEYLSGYRTAASGAAFMPSSVEEQRMILDSFLLQKALYEVSYELNNRPTWVGIPLRGILNLLS